MEFIDFRVPADGFSQPLLLWVACHDRAQRVALLLQRLMRHLQVHGPSEATRLTAGEVRRYMSEAAPRHHLDEDDDLFPRLKRRLDAARDGPVAGHAESTFTAIERLQREHHELDALSDRVLLTLSQVDSSAPRDEDVEVVERFFGSFVSHHGVEDQIIVPVASLALQEDDLAAIGESMAARRGTTWSALASRNGVRH